MQKQAYSKKFFTKYQPISFSHQAFVYTDPQKVILPREEICTLHYHNCTEIGICLEGSGIFIFGDRVECLRAGDACFVPAGVRHYSRAISKSPCVCIFVYVDTDVVSQKFQLAETSIKELLYTRQSSAVFKHGESTTVDSLLHNLCDSAKQGEPDLCGLRFLELLLTMPTSTNPSIDVQMDGDPIAPAIEYIYANYHMSLNNMNLASMCHLSESQFRRRFVTLYGITPHAYINRLRCKIAAQMLSESSRSIEEVAETVGYNATSDLFRNFKIYYAQSPSAWRKQHLG